MRPHRTTHRATRTLIGATCVLLLAVACGGDDDDDSADNTQPERSTTTASTTTTLPADGPQEWIDVVRGLNRRYFDLLQNPDPAKVADVYAETCPCYEQNHNTVQVLADGNEHIEGDPVAVTFVKLERNDPATQAVDLTIRELMTGDWQRVDQSGKVIQGLPADEPGCTALTLFPDGQDGAYRIHSRTTLTGCPPGAS
jgi:hypothetical protein